MWNFNKIQLSNYVTWKDLDFDFLEGVTFLTGNNFSGKSVTVSSLYPILLNEGTIPQGASARFFGNVDEKSFMFEMVRSTKSAKYNVCENDIDLAIHKISTAQEFIRNAFGISSDLFASTIFINGRKDHALASGKPSTRLDYLFNTLVSSDIYSKYNSIIEKTSKILAEKAVELRTLKDLLSKSKSDKVALSDFDIDEAKNKLSSYNKKVIDLSKEEDLIRKALELKEKPKVSFSSETEFKKELSILRKKLAKIESYERDKKKYRKIQKTLEEFNSLKSLLKAPDRDFSYLANGCKKQKIKIRESLDSLKEQYSLYKKQENYRKLSKETTNFSSNKQKVEEKLESLHEQYFHAKSVSVIEGHNADECPICNSKIDMSKIRAKAEKILNTYNEKKKILESDLEIIEARSIKLVEKVSINELEELEHKLESLVRFEIVCSYLADADIDVSIDKIDIDSDSISEKIDQLESEQNMLLIYLSRLEREKDNPFIKENNLDTKLSRLLDKKKSLTKKISYLSEIIPREEYKKESYVNWQRSHSSLISRIKDLIEFEKDIEIIKGLKKAFSRDGFRLHKLEQATSLFVSNLNALAPLIVQEPMKFEAQIDKRKCDILATRNGKSSTIFSLSGAESQIFKMIAALALIRCLPSNLRADTIILDEVEANCDEKSSIRYARDFIPELRKSVDKILVISPKSLKTLPLQPDHAFQVVKKAGRSTLETM